jgi:hypothetical protein
MRYQLITCRLEEHHLEIIPICSCLLNFVLRN